jgi:anti-repressor protein
VKQDDDDMSIMVRAMEIMQRTVAQKDELLLLQQPKVDGYDRLMESHNNVDFKDYVKTAKLKVGRNIFMSVLRDEKVLMENNTPYQNYIKQGYFKVVLTEKNGHSYPKTLITKKGIDWLNKKTEEWDLYEGVTN